MQLIPPNQKSNLANDRLLLPEIKSENQSNFETKRPKRRKSILDNLDKILFCISVIYLILILFWLSSKNKITLPWQSPTVTEITSKSILKISNSDAQFIKYMSQSLTAIERKIAAKQEQENRQLQSENSRSKVKIIEKIERVYIPVAANPEIDSERRLSVPKPPPIKGKNSLFSRSSTQETAANNTVTHVLVGLFESGNSSVALFSINGITKRIKIGQEIGRSGWTFIGAADREAKISRHGKVRHLATGEEI